jgi:hypothetical protein
MCETIAEEDAKITSLSLLTATKPTTDYQKHGVKTSRQIRLSSAPLERFEPAGPAPPHSAWLANLICFSAA